MKTKKVATLKVKLLKKTRKRYSIYKIEQVASNASEWDKDNEKKLGLPYYELVDHDRESHFYSRRTASKDITMLKDEIVNYVIKDYGEKFRHVDTIAKKVWYK